MSYTDEILDLLEKADSLEYGEVQMKLLERAIKLSTIQNDLDLEFEAKSEYADSSTFSGYPEKALVTFTWLLAMCDKYPKRFDYEDVLWKYKWILGSLDEFHHISKNQIMKSFADMEKRCKELGYGKGPMLSLYRLIYSGMLDEEMAAIYDKKDKDDDTYSSMSDCNACVLNKEITYLFFKKKYKALLKEAKPIITGEYSCTCVPSSTLPRLTIAAFLSDETQQAYSYYKSGIRKIHHRSPDFLIEYHSYIVFLTLIRHQTKAINYFQKQIGYALKSVALYYPFYFYLSARLLFKSILNDGRKTIRLDLPKEFELYEECSKYKIGELFNWFDEQVKRIALLFDKRNENSGHTDKIEEYDELLKLQLKYKYTPGL